MSDAWSVAMDRQHGGHYEPLTVKRKDRQTEREREREREREILFKQAYVLTVVLNARRACVTVRFLSRQRAFHFTKSNCLERNL